MSRLDLVHEHPRLAALSALTESSAPFPLEKIDSFVPPSLRSPAQSFTAALSSLDPYLPQEASAEEPPVFLASRASVLDEPAEPLCPHQEAPKMLADTKTATKVMKCRCDPASRVRSRLGGGFTFLMQICASTYLPQGRGDERQRIG